MEWLNYHHLLYFWLVAREGGLAKAGIELRLAPSTVSGQIRALEKSLGEKLFVRRGRRLVLTDLGQVVYRYADEIFSVGRELQDAVKGRIVGGTLELVVGIADVVPKLVARRLLQPALALPDPVHLVCREDEPDRLLADLARHHFDVVLSDAPVPSTLRVKAFSHLLGECGIQFFGAPDLARAHRDGFPGSLNGAPVLLPTENTALRRSLDQWFAEHDIRPRVVAECEDSALLQVFGESGIGLFPAHTVIADEVCRWYHVEPVGSVDAIRERFYAISVERRLQHPAVVAISEEARRKTFG